MYSSTLLLQNSSKIRNKKFIQRDYNNLSLTLLTKSNVFYILREAAGFNGRHRQLKSALSHSGS